ncbi:MAG: DUF4845 domain-containing protein [Burkholderiales bacterium]
MKKQSGITLSGFLMASAIVIVAALLAVKIIPAYTEYESIKRDMTEIVNNPDMADASDLEIRDAFAKKASVDDVTSVTAQDIQIDRDPFQLHVKYVVNVPLVTNFGLHFDFEVKAIKGAK